MHHEISEENLGEYNRRGLIPGPDESESEFLQRAEYCLGLKDRLLAEGHGEIEGGEYLRSCADETKKYYDLVPDWIPLMFDDHKLSFWHGGCAWIFRMEEGSPLAALLQLRKKLRDHVHFFLLNRKEILTHEIAHAGRMAFEEPRYEEILAYRSSGSRFRAAWGALGQNSRETGLFVLILFCILGIDLFLLFSDYPFLYLQAMPLKIVPLLMVFYAGFRLKRRQNTLDRCLNTLQKTVSDPEMALPTAYRLTDKEIDTFSRFSPLEIREYVNSGKVDSVRLRLIDVEYLHKK